MALLFAVAFFLAWAAMVAANDFRLRRIPNISVLAGLCGAILAVAAHANPFGVTWQRALLGGIVGLVALSPFFALRVMGAADVKVFAVLGVWCGMKPLLGFWLAASVLAGIHAVGLLWVSGTSVSMLRAGGGRTFQVGGFRSAPYGAFLTLSAAGWLLYKIYENVQ